MKILPGEEAFTLYDTFGFPLDITKEILRENDLSVDEAGFQKAMECQKEKARSGMEGKRRRDPAPLYKELASKLPPTLFKGYEKTKDLGQVVQIVRVKDKKHEPVEKLNEGEYGFILLNQTPFLRRKRRAGGGQGRDPGFQLRRSRPGRMCWIPRWCPIPWSAIGVS